MVRRMAATGLKIRAKALPVTHRVGGDTIRDHTPAYSLPEANTVKTYKERLPGEKRKHKTDPLRPLLFLGGGGEDPSTQQTHSPTASTACIWS